MKKRIAVIPESEREAVEEGLVHYDGVGMVSTMTLCGHVDRTTWSWEETNKRVNCQGCIAVRDHVLGRSTT